MSFFYGARSLSEVFYLKDFHALEKEYPNFKFYLALDRPDPEAMRSFGIPAMRIMAVSYLFCGWSTMISTYLQATEQVCTSMLIQLLRQFLLLIPFMWGLEKLLKITGIWLSFPVTETATFVLALLIFRAGRKKETLCSGTKTQ